MCPTVRPRHRVGNARLIPTVGGATPRRAATAVLFRTVVAPQVSTRVIRAARRAPHAPIAPTVPQHQDVRGIMRTGCVCRRVLSTATPHRFAPTSAHTSLFPEALAPQRVPGLWPATVPHRGSLRGAMRTAHASGPRDGVIATKDTEVPRATLSVRAERATLALATVPADLLATASASAGGAELIAPRSGAPATARMTISTSPISSARLASVIRCAGLV